MNKERTINLHQLFDRINVVMKSERGSLRYIYKGNTNSPIVIIDAHAQSGITVSTLIDDFWGNLSAKHIKTGFGSGYAIAFYDDRNVHFATFEFPKGPWHKEYSGE